MTGWYLRSCLVQNRRCAGFEIWHDNKDQASICVLIKCARHCLAAACSRNPVIIRKRSSLSSPIICPPHPLDSRSSSTSTKAPYLDALHRCSLSCDPPVARPGIRSYATGICSQHGQRSTGEMAPQDGSQASKFKVEGADGYARIRQLSLLFHILLQKCRSVPYTYFVTESAVCSGHYTCTS